jgi:two-component system chemotaxis response regulator CheY
LNEDGWLSSNSRCCDPNVPDAKPIPAQDWSFLIVDDNPAALATLRTLMLMVGLEPPLEASGGQEAMELVRDTNLDCIITDLRMEPMNGLDFIRWVRGSNEARTASVRILAMSAYRDPEEVADVTSAGANGFVSKPLSVPSLRRALQLLQDRSQEFVDISATPGPDRNLSTDRC